MKKIIFRFLIFILLLTFGFIIYLSTIGIKTRAFNDQIINEVKKINNQLELELDKISIILDPFKFKLVLKTIGANLKNKNKEPCMNMLRARLYDFEMKKKEEENQNNEASKSEIGWGHQIRSYVLQPYRLVKDNRTNFESTSPDKVLDGDIDAFLEKSLYQIK